MAPQPATTARNRSTAAKADEPEVETTTTDEDTGEETAASNGVVIDLPELPEVPDDLRNHPLFTSSARFLIERAQTLEKERFDLLKRITKNRESLRNMVDNEQTSDAETEWINAWYPEKERGTMRSKDEVTRTRKLREQARK